MIDDIVTRLRAMRLGDEVMLDDERAIHRAADEIELLRVALQMACYEVFAYCDPLKTSPNDLVAHFMNEAVRGD
jgi:hypothetical protein